MKLGRLLLLGALIAVGFNSYAQDEDKARECKRMRFLAGEELKIKNYPGAATYYLKGEEICGGYDAPNYARMIGTLRNAVNTAKDKADKAAYNDTLIAAWDRVETAGFYNIKDDFSRASAILQTTKPNRKKADSLFRRGIDTKDFDFYATIFSFTTTHMRCSLRHLIQIS